MSAFQYPLEVLAINHLSFGFLTSVKCVWTWVIIFTTAVVSVLAIRASSLSGKIPDEPSGRNQSSEEEIKQRLSNPSPLAASAAMDTVGRNSGKFSLYFNQKDEDDYEDDVVDINGDDFDGESGDEEVLDWVGEAMKVKMEDIGMYRCQDLRVLDGSVVRLWDNSRRRNPVTPFISCDGEAVVTW